MKGKRSSLFKIISIVLSVAVVLPVTLALVGDSGKAEAATSLPYIEKLKVNNSTFNILEIVPAEGEGSIGYYIGGQEPCADWSKKAAKLTGAVARKAYFDSLCGSLTNAGLLESDGSDSSPLEFGEKYSEALPWAAHDGYYKMSLDHNETAEYVSGTFTYAQNGAFVQNKDEFEYYIGGNYVQVIDYLSLDSDGSAKNPEGGDSYYYNPTFTEISDPSDAAGKAVYKNTATYSDPDADPVYEEYVYAGTAGDPDFPGMEIGKKYYYVSDFGRPEISPVGSNIYVAASTAYEHKDEGETGYFTPKSDVITYKYVGAGGTYDFIPDSTGNASRYNIIYGTVYYKGGFTNNDWFFKNVLDWTAGDTEPDVDFTVNSIVADKVSRDDVQNADMVVLSQGFKPGGTASVYGTDIGDDVKTAILNKVRKDGDSDTDFNLPVIVDRELCGSAQANINDLANSLDNGNPDDVNVGESFIGGSVFVFGSDGTRTALATDNFRIMYPPSAYEVSGSAFYPAYEEIVNENFLRTTEDPDSETLEEKVNMARAIRYILNYAGKRIITPKTTVNVLEIQPGSGSQLTEDNVKSWLGSSVSSSVTVNITTMSTAELIGKIDVISEKYDIVYIGSALEGFNPTNADGTDYNDDGMDGLIYSNIGDTVTVHSGDTSDYGKYGYSMSGLLDRDYSQNDIFSRYDDSTGSYESFRKLNITDQTRTFRYSGNDLTQTKMQELEEYVNSGYPLIVSDELVGAGHEATEAVTFRANVTGEAQTESGAALLTAAPSAENGQIIPSFLEPSYQWYEDGTPLSGETSEQYTADQSGSYYCTISYTADGTVHTARSNTVTVVITDPSIDIDITDDNGVTGTASFENGWNSKDYSYTVPLSLSGYKLTAAPQKFSGYGTVDSNDYSYQWYKKNDGQISGETGQSFTPTEAGTYYCQIDVTWLSYNYSWYTSDKSYWNWYSHLKNTTNGRSPDAVVTEIPGEVTVNPGTQGDAVTIPALSALSAAVDTDKVDNSSYMYELLDACKSRPNFMAQSNLNTAENQDKLIKYVNLSKPEIVWASDYPTTGSSAVDGPYPKEYANTNGVITSMSPKDDGSYCLEYYFSIRNNTDTDPVNTLYTCKLYIDANGDGRYDSSELLNDMVVRTWNGSEAGGVVNSSALKADAEYYVSRTMPSDKYGIVPWKLEIKKTGSSGIIALTSVHKYTHVGTPDGEQIKLDILQINASNGLSLESQMQTVNGSSFYSSVTGNYYNGIYGKLFADISEDYNVTISTVTTSYINDSTSWTHNGRSYDDLSDYLDSYNMVITGFKDMYKELDQASAAALASYIGTGKAILFTHDNTSFSNIPFDDYLTTESYQNYNGTWNNTVSPVWGYYFNVTIRDAVGLDRYGVTDPKYGVSTYAPPEIVRADDHNGWVAQCYPSGTVLDDLTDAGYSIAYKPKSDRSETVGETQGFTRGVLDRYKGSATQFTPQKTSTVSQVNEGQITTYPYDVNTKGFEDNEQSTNAMTIAATHSQYYQLNMNSSDTVVWYCLSLGADYSLFNDVSNAYYIYSKGNVTYSGAGHTTSWDTVNGNEPEAKLFVNTMIAAYRVAMVNPTVKFTDSSGENALSTFLIPSDEAGVLTPAESGDSARYIYFKVDDSNIGKNKNVRVSFSYGKSGTLLDKTVQIYKAESDTPLEDGESLVSGLMYYIKLDDLWSALPSDVKLAIDENGITVNATVSTSIGANTLNGTASMTLRKLTLFDLS